MRRKYLAMYVIASACSFNIAVAQTSGSTPMPAGTATSGGRIVSGTTPQPAVSTSDFVKRAAMGDMFEIESSRVMLDTAKTGPVHDFAEKMISDHTKADEQMKAAAKDQATPKTMDAADSDKIKQLLNAKGDQRTQTYIQLQTSAHEDAIRLFDGYAQGGENADLKAVAAKTLPTLREHLKMVQHLNTSQASAGATGAASSPRSAQYLTEDKPGMWRMSKMIALNVYNDHNEKIGDISEVLLDRNGKIDAVVIGVGGFLGIGEHEVAIPYEKIQWSMTPVSGGSTDNRSLATGSAMTGNTAQPATVGALATTPNASTDRAFPDHAVLANASKDELKNAPQFRYGTR